MTRLGFISQGYEPDYDLLIVLKLYFVYYTCLQFNQHSITIDNFGIHFTTLSYN